MPGTLPYTEYSLEQIIDTPSKVLVQSTIYQDKFQSSILQKMEFNQKIIPWLPPQNLVPRLWLWLVACFWKPVDVTIVTCHYPDLYDLNLARHVYFFTGSGYVPTSLNPVVLSKEVAKIISQIWQIYWHISNLKLSK
jgi:hypothetical protein